MFSIVKSLKKCTNLFCHSCKRSTVRIQWLQMLYGSSVLCTKDDDGERLCSNAILKQPHYSVFRHPEERSDVGIQLNKIRIPNLIKISLFFLVIAVFNCTARDEGRILNKNEIDLYVKQLEDYLNSIKTIRSKFVQATRYGNESNGLNEFRSNRLDGIQIIFQLLNK